MFFMIFIYWKGWWKVPSVNVSALFTFYFHGNPFIYNIYNWNKLFRDFISLFSPVNTNPPVSNLLFIPQTNLSSRELWCYVKWLYNAAAASFLSLIPSAGVRLLWKHPLFSSVRGGHLHPSTHLPSSLMQSIHHFLGFPGGLLLTTLSCHVHFIHQVHFIHPLPLPKPAKSCFLDFVSHITPFALHPTTFILKSVSLCNLSYGGKTSHLKHP